MAVTTAEGNYQRARALMSVPLLLISKPGSAIGRLTQYRSASQRGHCQLGRAQVEAHQVSESQT